MIPAARRLRVELAGLLAACLLLFAVPPLHASTEQAASESRTAAIASGLSGGSVLAPADGTRQRLLEGSGRALDAALTSVRAWTTRALLTYRPRSESSASFLLLRCLAAVPDRAPPSRGPRPIAQ